MKKFLYKNIDLANYQRSLNGRELANEDCFLALQDIKAKFKQRYFYRKLVNKVEKKRIIKINIQE